MVQESNVHLPDAESEATATRSEAPPPDELVDWRGTERFEVLRCIGRGGMGTVYEARDRERRQRVALKTLLHFDPAALFMFKQEFRTLADVQHPNLVRLHEFVAAEGERVFFSMELVRGTDFLGYVQRPGATPGVVGTSDVLSLQTVPIDAVTTGVLRRSVAPAGVEIAPASDGRTHHRASTADFDRLRPALRQLVEGVQAIHAAGKLHRDIKPSNVLVTPEGRVVILDFGVATEVPRVADEYLREQGQMVGTARYMAPEQAFDEAPTRAADWYSVGVMLYEALVGKAPFEGPAIDVVQMKAAVDARAPSQIVDGVPVDLDSLCRALLERDPAVRPTGHEILRRLGAVRASIPAPSLALEGGGGSLIGREAQLKALRDAFGASCSGGAVTVRVSGCAGMGKSVLVQRFLDTLVERGDAVVLRGRAYERESVPYKAVDAVIDALSRHLMYVSDNEGTIALPRDTDALARLFPVLKRVPAVSDALEQPAGDPLRVRRRAFVALRELLTTLAGRRPLVLCIDDVQWGDTDSAALLLELVRPPFAPPVMLVLAHREEDTQTAPFLVEMKSRWPTGAQAHDVSVGPLNLADARRVSLAILGSGDSSAQAIADAAARESGGSPFLVEELTRSSTGRLLAAQSAKVTLEQMVGDRLARLPEDARRLAEIIAVGGRPLPVSTVGDAAEMSSSEDVVALLCMRRFARTGLRDGRDVVEPLHDRIRETIVAMLPPEVVREHHGRLARVLEATPGADPEAVAVHLLGAGESERGARYAERAARQAAKQLALDQAARLYRLTIENLPPTSPKVARMRRRLAEVLGWAGRSEEAGRAYLAAAGEAPRSERFALERAASEQLLAAGRIDEGALVLRRLLANAGVPTPLSPLTAVFWLIWYKLRLKVFGLRFQERAEDQVRPEDHARLGAMNVGALGLASVDTVLSACMQARQMVESLRIGDRGEVLRAAIIYAIHLATRGGVVDKHEQALHGVIDRLVEAKASAEELAYTRGTGGVGIFLRGRWREALGTIDKAYANLPNHVAGWQTQASLYALYALVFLGDLVEARRRHARCLADADQRGDLFTSVQLRASHPTVLLLAADDPDAARRQTRQAREQWTHTKFLTQHWQFMRSEAEIELYAGNGARAYERLREDETTLRKSFLLNVQFMRALTCYVRGRAAIASIDANAEIRVARLTEARQLATRLEREGMAWTRPLGDILAAAAANAQGDRAKAIASLEAAAKSADDADMALYAAAARYQLGLVLGGKAGSQLVEAADEVMRVQEIRAPDRFATMLVPGTWQGPVT